jgi:K(+)-stimulated pyrophosphate-energized sodium pump
MVISGGLALGMKSTFLPSFVLFISIVLADHFAGLYGVAMGAVGMLSFVATSVTIDSYGPIADNAGGISEMAELEPDVRQITDRLDMVGNTTAAIGKGFAIGSASLAALSLFASYIYSQTSPGEYVKSIQELLNLNIINARTLGGAILGAALPYLFSGILIEAVVKSASKMVDEIRRQVKEMPGILDGSQTPDYEKCITISADGALKEMVLPAMISIVTPLVSGFVLGVDFVGGLLVGTTLSGIMLALFTANAGGAWDNAKKHLEQGKIPGLSKGSVEHAALVVGDTVGDPLKDTVGPSLDILIKIMAVVSLIFAPLFQKFSIF